MSTLLYRLGAFSFRHAGKVIATWLVLLVAILGGSVALGGQAQESFAIPGTESQAALDRLRDVFPQVAGASVQVVTVAPAGARVTDEAVRAAIEEHAEALRGIDGVDTVLSPFDEYANDQVSRDGAMAITLVQLAGGVEDTPEGMLDEVTGTRAVGEAAGARVEFGGQVFQQVAFGITPTEILGVVFAGVVLIVTFGSLLAAGMPLVSALIGVGVAIGALSAATAFVTISGSAPLLALMIGLAVGIDYALFILSRHRQQLAASDVSVEESAATSVATAGSAVVFAGVTVIIALLGLLVVQIPFLGVMGVGAAFAVLVAVAVAVTLLPALMRLAGERMRPRPGSRAARRAAAAARTTLGRRWVRGVMKHPWLASLGVVAVLGVLAAPVATMQLALPDGGDEDPGTSQRAAYDLVSEGFGEGYNGPLIVSIDITQSTEILDDLEAIGDELARFDGVVSVSQGIPDEGLDTAIIRLTPATAPDAPETVELVESLRAAAPELEERFDVDISITGTTAVAIDISQRLGDALLPFALVVVGLSIVLLMAVFRSVLVPVKAALGFLLSIFAALGVTVAVVQWGWGADLVQLPNSGPVLSFMPVIVMAVLFGLAMDYEVFLVSGMREEWVRTGDWRRAVENGFAGSARVVTAAALIMFFVFIAFVPEGAGTIKPVALGLAAGIAFDAFLVRMTLGPAVMTILRERSWSIPRWLDRRLPELDVEGERLRTHRAVQEWAQRQPVGVVLDGFVAGVEDAECAPLSASIPRGSIAVVTGDDFARRTVGAALAGRLPAQAGRAVVEGSALPGSEAAVARRVAMASASEASITVGELLRERAALAGRRLGRSALERELEGIRSALDGIDPSVPLAESPLSTLSPIARAGVVTAAALGEQPAVVVLDLPDSLDAALGRVLEALVPESVTLLVLAPDADSLDWSARGAQHLVPQTVVKGSVR